MTKQIEWGDKVRLHRAKTIGGGLVGKYRGIVGTFTRMGGTDELAYGIELDGEPYVIESCRASEFEIIEPK